MSKGKTNSTDLVVIAKSTLRLLIYMTKPFLRLLSFLFTKLKHPKVSSNLH